MHPALRLLLLPVTLAIAVGGWTFIEARCWFWRVVRRHLTHPPTHSPTHLLVLTLLLLVSVAQAAKVEPLTYKVGGRRYVIALPDQQLWSVAEVARAVQWHEAGKLFIGGQEIRQSRVRGGAGDRTNRNYLVTVMRTGKRLSPEARYFVRPDPWAKAAKTEREKVGKGESGQGSLPVPPKSLARSLSHFPTFPPAAPRILTLTWPDATGAVPGGWGNGPLMMPDGGPRFWGVFSTEDFTAWQFENRVTEPSCTVTSSSPHRFYVVRWRQ